MLLMFTLLTHLINMRLDKFWRYQDVVSDRKPT